MATEAMDAPRQRLHPWSWLFVLLAQLRGFALPVVALLVFGRGDGWQRWELLGGLAAGGLALASVAQYFTYRYGVVGTDLVVRAGLLNRNTRSIPLARIRNVTLHRTVLHRLFGVAEVRLESAGGATAEAQMRVLSMHDAAALERLVHAGQGAQAAGAGDAQAGGDLLLALPTSELVRLGLISNRGMVAVGAAFAGAWQVAPGDAGDWLEAVGAWLSGQATALHLGWLATLLGLLALVGAFVVLLRLLSIGLAIVQFHGFRLGVEQGALTVESGLLTRVRARAPLRKVQFWTVTETLLHRVFGRRSLAVETAVVHTGKESSRSIQHLAPVATPEATTAIVQRLLPQAGYPDLDWQPLHPAAWKRMSVWPVLFTLIACAALTLRIGPAGLLLLALLPWWILRARRLTATTGWALNDEVVGFRSGWLDRKVSFAELAKLQGVQVLHTPFDRRRGMATVVVDTAGAGALGHRIHIRYLPADVARALANRLGRRIARSPLAW